MAKRIKWNPVVVHTFEDLAKLLGYKLSATRRSGTTPHRVADRVRIVGVEQPVLTSHEKIIAKRQS